MATVITRTRLSVNVCACSASVVNKFFKDNNIYLFTAIGFSPGGSGYFTCIQNMKLVTTKFKSGGLHEMHVVATWNLGNQLSI
jgi:hypothetical protein